MKYRLIAAVCAAVLTAGCAATAAKTEVTVVPAPAPAKQTQELKNDADFARFGEERFRNILSAMQTTDYDRFFRDQVPERRKLLSRDDFPRMTANFNQRFGKLESLQLLGVVSKIKSRTIVWKGVFARTPYIESEMRRDGIDPAKAQKTESLIQIILVSRNGGWQVMACWIN